MKFEIQGSLKKGHLIRDVYAPSTIDEIVWF